ETVFDRLRQPGTRDKSCKHRKLNSPAPRIPKFRSLIAATKPASIFYLNLPLLHSQVSKS
ncbi:MAG: hypothetical protein B6245_08200, partial [Desulfobacteraceae bacterium 4572_88]